MLPTPSLAKPEVAGSTPPSAVRIGNGPGQISIPELEGRINSVHHPLRVVAQRDSGGKRVVNADGQTLYSFRFHSVDLSGYMVVKEGPLYRVRHESETRGMRASTKDLLERSSEAGGLPPRPAGAAATGLGGGGAAAGAGSAATGLADQLAQLTAKFEAQQEAQRAIAGELAAMARAVEAVARAPSKLTA